MISAPIQPLNRIPVMIPDYDRVMSFLANIDLDEIVHIVGRPQELKATLSRNYSEPEEAEPDTPEAAELAEADFLRDDRAEEMIYELLEESPETWATFKAAVHQLAPKSAVAEFLERYHPEEEWKCPEYYTDPPEYQTQPVSRPE